MALADGADGADGAPRPAPAERRRPERAARRELRGAAPGAAALLETPLREPGTSRAADAWAADWGADSVSSVELRRERLLVGVGDAGEALDLARARALVEALHVAPLALLDRGAHEHLDEALAHPGARLVARSPVGRDRGDERDHAVAREQVGHEGDAAHVHVAVLAREAEAGAEVLAHVVAVQHLDPVAAVAQLAGGEPADRRLARARQAGQPEADARRRRGPARRACRGRSGPGSAPGRAARRRGSG